MKWTKCGWCIALSSSMLSPPSSQRVFAKAEKTEFLSQLLVLLPAVLRVWLVTSLPEHVAADNPTECHEELKCSKYLPGPGPLNTSDNANTSLLYPAGTRGELWHCTENFTSFLWFRVVNNTFVPFPWGWTDGVELCDNNQTIAINSVQKRDEGIYAYKISNGTKDMRGYINFSVSCSAQPGYLVSDEQPVQYVSLGEHKTLHCAADFGDCIFHDGSVKWLLRYPNGTDIHLRNSSNRHIRCSPEDKGGSCNLTFSGIAEEDFGVEFICRLCTPAVFPDKLNYSVCFMPIESAKKSWRGSISGGALGCMFICVVFTVLKRRYSNVLKSWLKEWQHDIVVIHGEGERPMVETHIKPELTNAGYDVIVDVGRVGAVTSLEQANAIGSARVVIFFFPEEISSGEFSFLADYAKRDHLCSRIIVIHPEEEELQCLTSPRGDADREAVTSERQLLLDNGTCRQGNAWGTNEYSSFKNLTLPRVKLDHESSQPVPSRELDKFWCNLRKSLPRPQNRQNSWRHDAS